QRHVRRCQGHVLERVFGIGMDADEPKSRRTADQDCQTIAQPGVVFDDADSYVHATLTNGRLAPITCAKSAAAYLFGATQIFNLPYRRFVIGRTLLAGGTWQVTNRLQTCESADCRAALLAWPARQASTPPHFVR